MKTYKNKKLLIIFCIVIICLFIQFINANYYVFAAGDDATKPVPQALSNPLGVTDPRELIGKIIGAVLGIIGSIALAIFIYGGFTWMTSAGSPEKVRKGRDMIIWAVMGLAIIFLSYAIVYFVIGAFTGG